MKSLLKMRLRFQYLYCVIALLEDVLIALCPSSNSRRERSPSPLYNQNGTNEIKFMLHKVWIDSHWLNVYNFIWMEILMFRVYLPFLLIIINLNISICHLYISYVSSYFLLTIQ